MTTRVYHVYPAEVRSLLELYKTCPVAQERFIQRRIRRLLTKPRVVTVHEKDDDDTPADVA